MTYFGGKAQDGVYQAIINQIPAHDRYIELFLGGGAIMLKKKPFPDPRLFMQIHPTCIRPEEKPATNTN